MVSLGSLMSWKEKGGGKKESIRKERREKRTKRKVI